MGKILSKEEKEKEEEDKDLAAAGVQTGSEDDTGLSVDDAQVMPAGIAAINGCHAWAHHVLTQR